MRALSVKCAKCQKTSCCCQWCWCCSVAVLLCCRVAVGMSLLLLALLQDVLQDLRVQCKSKSQRLAPLDIPTNIYGQLLHLLLCSGFVFDFRLFGFPSHTVMLKSCSIYGADINFQLFWCRPLMKTFN